MQAEHFEIERTGVDSYRLAWAAQAAPLEIHPSLSPDDAAALPARIEIFEGWARIENLARAPRHFFHLRGAGGASAVVADRHVPLQGARNFRDFGGYATADGRCVRWGHLYRSGQLGGLTAPDQQQVAALGIRLICDFRRDTEREDEPNRLAPEHRPRIENLPIAPGNTANVMLHFAGAENGGVTADHIARTMLDINRDFALAQRPAYRRMFDALLEEDGPLLVHCAVGKDRTGFAAALILAALGVPEQTIVRDYLLTTRYLPAQEEVARFVAKYGVSMAPELMLPLLEARENYLRAALTAIEEGYGGMAAYLREYLELDESMLDTLRGRLLVG